ncbi:MAG: PAS domain S-box protein, partial [Nitrospirae bacterium]|nr:PAS domain S-box protein [Nitrospirota bacterium]
MENIDNLTKEKLIAEITDLKAQLDKSKAVIKLIENANEIIFRYSLFPEPKWEFMNNALTKITGYTPEDCYKDPDLGWKMVHPDDRQLVDKTLYLKGSDPVPVEVRWITKDGRIIWMEQLNTPVFDEEGKLIAIEGIKRDVTDRHITQEKIAESEEKYRNITEKSFDVILLLDIKGYLLYASTAIERITGFKAEEVIGRHLKEFISKEDLAYVFGKFDEVLNGKTLEGIELKILKKDGSHTYIEITAFPILKNNEITQVQVIYKDISKRKRAENSLIESEERFRSLFENLPDAIFLADPETGILVDANIQAEKLLKKNRNEIIGMHQSKLHPKVIEDVSIETFKSHKDMILGGLSTTPVEINVACSDGSEVPVEIVSHIARINDKPLLQGVFRDISARVERERLKTQNAEFYKILFENNKSIMLLIDPNNVTFVDVNAKACEFYGYTREEFLTKTISDLNPRPLTELLEIRDKIKTEKLNHFITKHRLSNGDMRDVEIFIGPIISNQKLLLFGIIHDISDRIKLETELKENQVLLQSIMDNSPAAIFIKNLNGQYIKVSSRFKELFDIKIEDVLFKTPSDILPKEDAAYLVESDKV